MNKLKIIALFSLAFTTAAFADCETAEANLFSCTFENGAKTVEVCMVQTSKMPNVNYRFGQTGQKSELEMTLPFSPAKVNGSKQRWPQDGYDGYADGEETSIILRRGNYQYSVIESGGSTVDHGIAVLKDGAVIAQLTCDPNSHSGRASQLFDELQFYGFQLMAYGQPWNYEEYPG